MCMIGVVGTVSVFNELRLEEVPDMGYDPLGDPSCGEICVRGKTVFAGYHKSPELTREAIKDGWFHTGDIGQILPNGSIKIIDRKKNLIKLSQGEYVALEYLENVYGISSVIDDIWVYGNSFKSKLVAVVVPEENSTKKWADLNGHTGSFSDLCSLDQLKNYILEELKLTAERNKLRGFEYIKGIIIEPRPFDMERDLVTATLKKKRNQLLKYYQALANAWKDASASTSASTVLVPRGTYKLKEASFKGPCKAPIELQVKGTLQAPQDGAQLSKPDTWINFPILTVSHYRVVEPLMAKDIKLGHEISIESLGKYQKEDPVNGINISNGTLSNTSNGVRIKTWPNSPSPVTASDIHFENIIMNNAPSKIKISNVSFKNIRGTSSTSVAVKIAYAKGLPCEKVEMTYIDLKYNGNQGSITSQCSNVKPTVTRVANTPSLLVPRNVDQRKAKYV
ncbi:hypothetical protein ACLB2K_007358 [Fragaria x ananassa]